MRTAEQILKKKGPHFNYIDANATMLEALNLMKSENISYLIVTSKGKYEGIVSERDYTHKVMLQNLDSKTSLVKDIMSRDMPVVSCLDSAEYCMILMNASKCRYLPVFEANEFKGIITMHDLMREAIAENQERHHEPSDSSQISNAGRYYWV